MVSCLKQISPSYSANRVKFLVVQKRRHFPFHRVHVLSTNNPILFMTQLTFPCQVFSKISIYCISLIHCQIESSSKPSMPRSSTHSSLFWNILNFESRVGPFHSYLKRIPRASAQENEPRCRAPESDLTGFEPAKMASQRSSYHSLQLRVWIWHVPVRCRIEILLPAVHVRNTVYTPQPITFTRSRSHSILAFDVEEEPMNNITLPTYIVPENNDT